MLHSLCLCWSPKVEQQSRLDAPGGRVSAEPEGRQSMGRSAAEATATEPCCSPCLQATNYRAWICLLSFSAEQLMNWKGLEGSSAPSKFLLEPVSHLLSAASWSGDTALPVS